VRGDLALETARVQAAEFVYARACDRLRGHAAPGIFAALKAGVALHRLVHAAYIPITAIGRACQTVVAVGLFVDAAALRIASDPCLAIVVIGGRASVLLAYGGNADGGRAAVAV
jgi:hypothetical protein